MNSYHQILFEALGVEFEKKRKNVIDNNWKSYRLGSNEKIPIIFIDSGPNNINEIKKLTKNYNGYIIYFKEKNILLLKAFEQYLEYQLIGKSKFELIASIFERNDTVDNEIEITMTMGIQKAIETIPTEIKDFDNRGLFSTHYLLTRLFNDVEFDIDDSVNKIHKNIENDTVLLLKILGWNVNSSKTIHRINDVSIVTTLQKNISIRQGINKVSPSYIAIAELKKHTWVILTNGNIWRLYSNKISASTTNYFEIHLDKKHESITQYLVAIFSAESYIKKNNKINIEVFFEEGKIYAQNLEENLSKKILKPNGLFLDLVKGVLNHDGITQFSDSEINKAKGTSLKIMYRLWFILYAESRGLLPVKDEKYQKISLQSLRKELKTHKKTPNGIECYKNILKLFKGIRNGNPFHNIPQYNGALFKLNSNIDSITIQNKFIVKVLYELLEKDKEPIDYGSLSVRHLGGIYEKLLESVVRQVKEDTLLLDGKKNTKKIKNKQEADYYYKKNDLYLIGKGGSTIRKETASYYTPEEVVKFLVSSGLKPILEERQIKIKQDIQEYKKNSTDENKQKCFDRLLDIQVLDPAMGSGHFLVEALNQITQWATEILNSNRDHPLLSKIEKDRQTVINEQRNKGIKIDQTLLTHDVLLKRQVMKRCIFGVDLNPLAVEIARLSLWLDSFAIGAPLTFMDHHIKQGDSTIGSWLDDLEDPNDQSLDNYMPNTKNTNAILTRVSNTNDITVNQVKTSKEDYEKYMKQMLPYRLALHAITASHIDETILPKKHNHRIIERLTKLVDNTDKDLSNIKRRVNELASDYHFFHWELEMLDAFNDTRKGFDLIISNPPWERVKPSTDEFFMQYDSDFRSFNTKEKKECKLELLKNIEIKKSYEKYTCRIKNMGYFYQTSKIKAKGDLDLWQLILERATRLIAKRGIISIVLPSQILGNVGSKEIRANILNKDILQLYVFENTKKIFPIHSSYRFALLTFRNDEGNDKFPVGFYLQNVLSLTDESIEKEKFSIMSKNNIKEISPNDLIIPETDLKGVKILKKCSKYNDLGMGLDDNWNLEIAEGFRTTDHNNIINEDGKGWSLLRGKNINHFEYNATAPKFAVDVNVGLRKLERKKVYMNHSRDFYNSFRLAFRDISGMRNARTVVASIIPPHKFHVSTLRTIILTHDGKVELDNEYNKKTAYLLGILNSMTFDFLIRQKIQIHTTTIIKNIKIPNKSIFDDQIIKLATKLTVGTEEFKEFADSIDVENITLNNSQRIYTIAKLDALIAHAYGMTKEEYQHIQESFISKKKESVNKKYKFPYENDTINWSDESTLRHLYNEVRKYVMEEYDNISKKKGGKY